MDTDSYQLPPNAQRILVLHEWLAEIAYPDPASIPADDLDNSLRVAALIGFECGVLLALHHAPIARDVAEATRQRIHGRTANPTRSIEQLTARIRTLADQLTAVTVREVPRG